MKPCIDFFLFNRLFFCANLLFFLVFFIRFQQRSISFFRRLALLTRLTDLVLSDRDLYEYSRAKVQASRLATCGVVIRVSDKSTHT